MRYVLLIFFIFCALESLINNTSYAWIGEDELVEKIDGESEKILKKLNREEIKISNREAKSKKEKQDISKKLKEFKRNVATIQGKIILIKRKKGK